ncbi:MAG: hypothetical protein ACFFCK_06885 [Promethearchaeota archaeon]
MTSDNTVPETDPDTDIDSWPFEELELAKVEPCLSLCFSCCILILVAITLGMSLGTMMTTNPSAAITGVGLSALTLAILLVAIQVYRSNEVRRRDSGNA